MVEFRSEYHCSLDAEKALKELNAGECVEYTILCDPKDCVELSKNIAWQDERIPSSSQPFVILSIKKYMCSCCDPTDCDKSPKIIKTDEDLNKCDHEYLLMHALKFSRWVAVTPEEQDFATAVLASEIKDSNEGGSEVFYLKKCSRCYPVDHKFKTKEKPSFHFSDSPSLETLRRLQAEFCRERDWDQYHSPRNLLLALVGEVGELAELFQWKDEVKEGLPCWTEKEKIHVGEEISDVLIYLIRLAEKCHIDLPQAVVRKMEINGQKYPIDQVKGLSKKYTEYTELQNISPE